MARRQGSSGEEPRFRRAPVLSSRELEDLGRRLIVLDGVSEFLEVDAHALLLYGTARDRPMERRRVFLRRVYEVWRRGDACRLCLLSLRGPLPRQAAALVPILLTGPILRSETCVAPTPACRSGSSGLVNRWLLTG